MTIRPEDVLPDETNFAMIDGVKVRKGTVAAVLENLKLLDSDINAEKKAAIMELIQEFAPALVVLGFKKYLTFNNPEIQRYVDEAAKKLGKL